MNLDTIAKSYAKTFGWVYVLSNPCMPGLLKIGVTLQPVKKRVRQLSGATGVPKPFVIEYASKTLFAREVERLTHEYLWNRRVSSNREFFACDLEEALTAYWHADMDVEASKNEEAVERLCQYYWHLTPGERLYRNGRMKEHMNHPIWEKSLTGGWA